MKDILHSIRSDVGYKNEYNEPEFEEVILRWRQTEKSALDKNMERKIFEYLQHTIDERVDAIVSGGHRGSYYGAALLAAALGEVEKSMGKPLGKEQRIEKYLKAFPRHRAFKAEMQAFRG